MKTTIDGYGEALVELGRQKEEVVVISADSTANVKQFADDNPNRVIQCGIAEQNVIGISAGLALEGKIPFANATLKNWEQLRSACNNNLNIKITSQEDSALARSLPNITILVPADYNEAKKATIAAGLIKGPVYLKLNTEKHNTTTEKTPFTVGRAEILREGKDCTIIACGAMVHEAIIAAQKLADQDIDCTVLNCHTIKPIDKHAITASARLTKCVVTTEEHQTGLGNAVAELLGQYAPVPIRMIEKSTYKEIMYTVKEILLQNSEDLNTEIQEKIQPELHFKIHGKGKIKSIPELHKELLNMSDETFAHHCNENKNDFSAWVKNVFKNYDLAKQMEEKRTRMGMVNAIARWLR